jgi:hypothetical protein
MRQKVTWHSPSYAAIGGAASPHCGWPLLAPPMGDSGRRAPAAWAAPMRWTLYANSLWYDSSYPGTSSCMYRYE